MTHTISNPDAERTILGTIFRDNSIIPDVLEKLSLEDFHIDTHQWIFRGIKDLHISGKTVSPDFIHDWLLTKGKTDRIRPEYYISLINQPGTVQVCFSTSNW